MTAEKLYEILSLIAGVDEELQLQSSLTQVQTNLNNLTSSPADTNYQKALGTALQELTEGAEQIEDHITPSQMRDIAELGGEEFFDPAIAEKVRDSVQSNAMTPSVARDYVQALTKRRKQFLDTIESTLAGLGKLLAVEAQRKTAPDVEAAFTIPRELFSNELGPFGNEITFINRLLGYLSEAVTGEIQPVELKSLSTSVPVIGVLAGLGVLKLLGEIVNSFLDAWEKVQKMRKVREEVDELGLSDAALDEISKRITGSIEDVVAKSVQTSLSQFNKDGNRRNELENGLRREIKRLYGQIERGLTVEIRVNAPTDKSNPNGEQLKALEESARKMRFPEVSRNPILLTSGQLLDGELPVAEAPSSTRAKKATKEKTPKKE